MQKAKSESSLETFATGKTDRESKDPAIFSIRLEPAEKSGGLLTEIPGSCETLDVPRYICPLIRPPYMKRLSPSLPDGPTFFKKIRCRLNLAQR
jgi:hypothetical protein